MVEWVVPGGLITTASKAVLKDINFGKIFPRLTLIKKLDTVNFTNP